MTIINDIHSYRRKRLEELAKALILGDSEESYLYFIELDCFCIIARGASFRKEPVGPIYTIPAYPPKNKEMYICEKCAAKGIWDKSRIVSQGFITLYDYAVEIPEWVYGTPPKGFDNGFQSTKQTGSRKGAFHKDFQDDFSTQQKAQCQHETFRKTIEHDFPL